MKNKQSSEDELARNLERAHEKILNELPLNDPSLNANVGVGILNLFKQVKQLQDKNTARNANDLTSGSFDLDDLSLVTSPGKIGRFEIQRQIGKGGFGVVFLARDPSLDRDVALKIPRIESITTPALKERFLREGRAAAALAHPNIVPVFEAGQIGSTCYLASPFVDGETLAQWLVQHQQEITPHAAADIARSISEALAHAHQRGVIHRDIKPSNILIDGHSAAPIANRIQITDFGLAKYLDDDSSQTLTGELIGTPSFMSPEQARQAPATQSSDVYSTGAVLYNLLTGRAPFEGGKVLDTIQAVANQPPVPPRRLNPVVPADLEAICLKCLEKKPTDRYPTAIELRADLERFLAGEPVQARAISSGARLVRWFKRYPVAAALLGVIALSTVVVSILLWRSENLRSLSELRERQVLQKTDEMQQAIERLFIAVAETPELQLSGLDPFKKRMIAEASVLYSRLVQDVPDDVKLFEKYANTKLNFAKLSYSLGEEEQASQVVDELSAELADNLAKLPVGDGMRKRFLLTKINLDLLKTDLLKGSGSDAEIKKIHKQILEVIDGELASVNDVETTINKALTISRIAMDANFYKGVTFANELNPRALELWKQVPAEQLNQPSVIERLAACFYSNVATASSTENTEQAAQLALQALDILEPKILNNKNASPESQYHLAQIYRIYGFLMRDNDNATAIELTEKAHQLSLQLAQEHPWIILYQSYTAVSGYSFGLMHFIARNLDESEKILSDNVERCKKLLVQFPEDQHTNKQNMSNSLTVLGLIYKKREQWEKQLPTLELSKEIVTSNLDKTGQRQFKVLLAGVNAEIGLCHSKSGDHEKGLEIVLPTIKELDDLIADDPEDGQANRFLKGNLEFLSEILRRMGRFDEAQKYFDRIVAMEGGEVQLIRSSAMIELVCGLEEFDKARELIEEYRSNMSKLEDAYLRTDARTFAFAIANIESKRGSRTAAEPADEIKGLLVQTACEDLALWIDRSDEPELTIKQIENDHKLEPLRDTDLYKELIELH